MPDETLGRDPLGEELDSIWKIPKPKTPAPQPEPPPTVPSVSLDDEREPGIDDEGDAMEPHTWDPLEEPVSDHNDTPSEAQNTVTPESQINDEYTEEKIQLVGFRLEHDLYGLEITTIQEIIRVPEITRVPKAPGHISGVVNLRGKVIPIVKLKERLGFADDESAVNDTRIIIVNSVYGMIGLKVDAVTNVFRVARSDIIPPPPSHRLNTEYVDGVGRLENDLIVILNVDKLLAPRESDPARYKDTGFSW